MTLPARLWQDQSGATAVEYGLFAALISIAAIAAMQGASNQLKATFNSASSAMSGPNAA